MIALQRQVCRLQTLRIAELRDGALHGDVDVAIRELVDVILSIRPVPEPQLPQGDAANRGGRRMRGRVTP